ncbi:copper resistance CopC family protein [Neobacillus vireti]|uniref:copper resistance CopC family protein n=1 Tax=Neobacillus vireti TaxID=220686 RepID=UPI00300007E4
MKKFSLLIICMLFVLPSIVSAHTHLSSSNPAEGQVVVDELKEIILTFDGSIEKLSTMKVFKDGTEITPLQIQIEAERMAGTLAEPLANGAYIIQWNIAGVDGHPISGEINFTVEREGQNTITTNTSPDSTESSEENRVEVQITTSGNGDSNASETQVSNDTMDDNSSSNTTTILTILGFVIILGIGLLLIRRKK